MGLKKEKSKSMGLNYIALDKCMQAEHSKTKKKLKKKKEKEFDNSPGVVFLKHIPYGFFEPQMKKYFEQFGKITRLRLARSKKTGKSKGYAYIEFAHKDVAKLVAETMNNYLLFTRILKCDFVAYEDLHEKAFVGCYRVFQKPKSRKLAIMRYNRRTVNIKKIEKQSTGKKRKLALALEKLGVEYNTDNVKGNPDIVPPPRKCSKTDTKTTMDTDKTNIDENGKGTEDPALNPSEGEDLGNISSLSSATDYDDSNTVVVDPDETEITFKVPESCKKVISLEEHVERQKKRKVKEAKKKKQKLNLLNE